MASANLEHIAEGSDKEYDVPNITCSLCGISMPSVPDVRVPHVMEHFDPTHSTGIKCAKDLQNNPEAYQNFIHLHHRCFG